MAYIVPKGQILDYVQWLDFIQSTQSTSLRAAMMDLHWFHNNGSLRLGIRDLFRFVLYLLRRLAAPRLAQPRKSDLIFAIDTPGVGGVETLLPLLQARPAQVTVTLAVTDFIARDARLALYVQGDHKYVQVVNMDRLAAPLRWNQPFASDLVELARKFPRLWATLPLYLLRYMNYVACAGELLDVTGAQALIVFNERMLPSACFSEAARLAGVVTHAVQHGNFVDNYLPVMVDNYLIWGRFHEEWLARRSNCRTTVIGSPRLDRLGRLAKRAWRLPTDRPPHLVFFSQVGSATVPHEWISRTRKAILGLASRKELQITVKLHPLDTRERWNTEGPEAACVRYLDGSVPIAEALRDADLASSFYSTVLAESLLYNLPVLQLNPFPELVPYFPNRNGIASVETEDDMLRLISKWRQFDAQFLELQQHQQYLCDGYFSHLGHASERFWSATAS